MQKKVFYTGFRDTFVYKELLDLARDKGNPSFYCEAKGQPRKSLIYHKIFTLTFCGI